MKLIKWFLIKINQACHFVFLPFLLLFCIIARFTPKKIDIGMGPLPLINNVYWAKALRLKGYTVQTFVTDCYFITSDFDLRFDKGFNKIYFYIPALLFLRTIFSYKIIYVYFNGGALQLIPGLRLIEPQLYKLANVKTVVMPYGSDAQTFLKTPNKLMANALCIDYPDFFRKNQRRIERQVLAWSRYADIVIAAMDSIDYIPFWNRISHCHYAIDTDSIQPVFKPLEDTIKILHAPNHKAVKGSSFIVKAIEELKKDGYKIELVFKQGVSNKEFLEVVAQADIVVDQLIMGWYAMFSMEAMAMGKPVVCALREDLVWLYENAGCVEKGEIPLINASPTTIKEVLKNLIDEKENLYSIGKKSRDFVVKYHSIDVVGDYFDKINQSLIQKQKEKQI